MRRLSTMNYRQNLPIVHPNGPIIAAPGRYVYRLMQVPESGEASCCSIGRDDGADLQSRLLAIDQKSSSLSSSPEISTEIRSSKVNGQLKGREGAI
uniref:Uncharacterized protein n=1 Tax=Romanomermis culicivorax TaxID=13658 RepID=A0A915JTU1_ROMCU